MKATRRRKGSLGKAMAATPTPSPKQGEGAKEMAMQQAKQTGGEGYGVVFAPKLQAKG